MDLRFSTSNQITLVTNDILTFFKQKCDLPKIILPLKSAVFPFTQPKIIDPTVDDSKKLKKAISQGVNAIYNFLFANPQLCPFVVQTLPESTFISTNPSSNLSELFTLGVLSNSIYFLKIVLTNTKSYNLKVNRKYTSLVQGHIESKISAKTLHIDFSSRSNGYPFVIDDISCASAFAASQSEVYVGQTGGLIRVLGVSSTGKPVTKYNLWKAVDNGPYSLCWAHDRLFMITEKQAFMINVTTNAVTEILNKPDKLVPPVCTDGHFFYSIRVLVRKGKLSIFSFHNLQFCQENNLVLRGSIADSYSELRIPFVTDGIRMTFATPRGKSTHFLEFSLETGRLINDLTLNCSTVINSWCIRPYGVEHVALTSSDISFYRNSLQVPRWLIGIPFPTALGTLNPFFILMNGLFHGSCVFIDNETTCITEMMESFIETMNTNGVYVAGMMLLDNLSDKNIDRCVSLFVQVFHQFESPQVRRFVVFIFLACFNYLTDKKKYEEENIVNDYLEKSDDMDFIWFFSNYFDFKTLKFSRIVVNKIMLYVCQSVRIFPQESLSIMTNCCMNYINPIIEKHESSDDIMIPLKAIIKSVVQRVLYYLPQISDPSEFVNSQHFLLWKFSLKALYNVSNDWPNCIHFFQDTFIKLIFQVPEENEKNAELLKMLNRNLYITIGMLLSSPYQHSRIIYTSIDDFYEQNPDPFNRMRPKLDERIFSLLSISYDITTKEQFSKTFVSLRKELLFDSSIPKTALEQVQKFKSISSVGLTKYLNTNKLEDLYSFTSDSLFEKFIKAFSKTAPKLTIPQQVVFSMFSSYYFDRSSEFLTLDEASMQVFVKLFSFPFFFPPSVLSHYKFSMNTKDIENLNEDFILKFFDSFSAMFPQLENSSVFVDNFLKNASDPSLISSQAKEPILFKSALFCLLAVINGATINMEKEYHAFVTYIISGSLRVISAILKIISALDEHECDSLDNIYKFLLDSISAYIVNNESFFVMQTEQMKPLQSVFGIIQTLKSLFNREHSMFTRFLERYALKSAEKIAPAVFAILQNYLEALRPGVVVHFTDSNKTHVTGNCIKCFGNTISILLKNGEEKKYHLTKCTNVWCECIVKVNLKVISDFSLYFALLSTPRFKQTPSVEVFRYASFLEFIKMPSFFAYCSSDLFKDIISPKQWNRRIRPEEYASDFFYALQTNSQKTKDISFVAIDEDIIETPISPVATNCLLSEFRPNNSKSGMLMTMNKVKEFVSSPFHPSTKFSLSFVIYPSQNIETEYPMLVTVFAYSESFDTFLESKCINVRCNISDNRIMKIDYDPSEGAYTLIVDDSVVQKVALPPSTSLLFVDIRLVPSMIVDYSLSANYEVFEFRQCKDSSLYSMQVSTTNSVCPLSDSSLYNFASLSVSSKHLETCFKQMMALEIASKKHSSLPAEAVLSVLSSVNCSYYCIPLDLMKMPLESLFYSTEKAFFALVKNMSVDFDSVISHINEMISQFSNLGFTYSNCNGALVMPKGSSITASNCYVINESSFKQIGFSKQLIKADTLTCLIPTSSFEGTCSQVFAYIQFCISLMIRDKYYNFTKLAKALDFLVEKLPCFKNSINILKERIHILSPPVPEENKLPKFNILSFLVRESVVHLHPEKFLAPVLAEKIGKAVETRENQLIFLAKYKNAVIEAKNGSITVAEGEKKTRINEGEFVIIQSNCSIEYETEETKAIVFFVHDYLTVAKELILWRPHNTHQLLCAFTGRVSKHVYKRHPLSSKFSHDTAAFIFILTKELKASKLFELQRHSIGGQAPAIDALMNIDYCRLIADQSHNTPERVKYATAANLFEKSPVDAHLARILPFINLYDEKHDEIVNSIFSTSITSKRKSFAFHWLKSFLRKSPTQVVLNFIEFVNGKYGFQSLHDSPIYMWLSEIPNLIDTVQSEGIIILGKFYEEEKFVETLKEKLQSFLDNRFD